VGSIDGESLGGTPDETRLVFGGVVEKTFEKSKKTENLGKGVKTRG